MYFDVMIRTDMEWTGDRMFYFGTLYSDRHMLTYLSVMKPTQRAEIVLDSKCNFDLPGVDSMSI